MFDDNQIRINKGLDTDFNLGEFDSEFVHFDKNNSYIVYNKGILFGFYNVMRIESESTLEIQYALIKTFRGNHIGQLFLNRIIDIVSKENADMKKIVAMIKYNNDISKKIAEKEQFTIDTGLLEQLEEELDGLVPYSKENVYYKNKKLCLQKQ